MKTASAGRLRSPLAAALAAAAIVLGLGCGGADEAAEPRGATAAGETEAAPETGTTDDEAATTEDEPAAAAGLPPYLAGYDSWTHLNDEPIPPRESGDAHLGTKEIYTSAAAVDRVYPAGTIIVKEATRPDSDFVGLVAVMRKLDGFAPENNDWEMIEYTRGSPGEPFAEIASGGVCYSCHVGAREFDYVCSAAGGDVCG